VATPRSTAFSVALHISFSHRLISSVCNPSKKFPNRPRKVHAICTGLTCRYRGRTSWYCPSRHPANSRGSLSAQMALFRARSHIYMQKNVQKNFSGRSRNRTGDLIHSRLHYHGGVGLQKRDARTRSQQLPFTSTPEGHIIPLDQTPKPPMGLLHGQDFVSHGAIFRITC